MFLMTYALEARPESQLTGFCTTPNRRITVAYGGIMYGSRCCNPSLQRKSTRKNHDFGRIGVPGQISRPQALAERSHRPAPDADVREAVALAFSRRTQRAVHRDLLRGYRREEDALNTVRGQSRFTDQIGRRYGLPLPIEVAYDE